MRGDDLGTWCWSYCTHGGVCELEVGHGGLHDSRFCRWSDAEALSKEDADALLAGKSELGAAIVAVTDIALGLVGETGKPKEEK